MAALLVQPTLARMVQVLSGADVSWRAMAVCLVGRQLLSTVAAASGEAAGGRLPLAAATWAG
jgi:hypothetical protein